MREVQSRVAAEWTDTAETLPSARLPHCQMAESEVGEMSEKSSVEPPLGIMPRRVFYANWQRARLHEVSAAIFRYTDRQMMIPLEWALELEQLIKSLLPIEGSND